MINKFKPQTGILLVITAILMATLSCTLTRSAIRVGELRSETEEVPLGSESSVRVNIEMAAGELNIHGGAAELLEAEFTYNVDEFKPEVAFSGGTLSIQTPDVEGIGSLVDIDDYRYEWELHLNDDVQMEMTLRMGAGVADLDLGSLTLTRLDFDAGAGDINLDLSNSVSLSRLDVDLGAGDATIDLSGDIQSDLDARVRGGVGKLTLQLPRDVGVRVDIDSALTNINARDLNRDGNAYVNDAYGESGTTLRIDIDAGIGEINLEVGD